MTANGTQDVRGLGKVRRVDANYDYENNGSRCGICGGLGVAGLAARMNQLTSIMVFDKTWREEDFEGETEAEVKAAVEAWARKQIADVLGLFGITPEEERDNQ